jgi:hypothetical protein
MFLIGCMLTFALMLNACQPATDPAPDAVETQAELSASPTESPPASPVASATPVNTTPASARADVPDEAARAIETALHDLAQRTKSDPEALGVVRVTEMQWPDAALGCPLPATAYAQQATPGYLVLLAHEGQQYEYHTDTGKRAVLCGDDGAPVMPNLPLDKGIDDGDPWLPAG